MQCNACIKGTHNIASYKPIINWYPSVYVIGVCGMRVSMDYKNVVAFQLVTFCICLAVANSVDVSYPAVFNFGDSNSDTGELAAAMGFVVVPPNGQNYFKTSSGRFCDGRLIVDFLSKFLIFCEIFFDKC